MKSKTGNAQVGQGNCLYLGSLEPSLAVKHEFSLTKGSAPLMGPIITLEDKILASCGNYLACLSAEDKEVAWEVLTEEEVGARICGEGDFVYLAVDGKIVGASAVTGATLWTSGESEFIASCSDERLVTFSGESGVDLVRCRSKDGGELVWTFDGSHGFPNRVLCANGIVILQGSQGFHALREDDGTVLWDFWKIERLTRFFPEHTTSRQQRWRTRMGPLVSGKLFVSWIGAILVAIDVQTGEDLWSLELEHMADTMIFRDDKLYFDRYGLVPETINFLTCVDATSGKIVYTVYEPLTPAGSCNPMMSDQHFITGWSNCMSVFDVERREFVWRYKLPRNKPIFGGGFARSGKWLLMSAPAWKTIYWLSA